MTAPAFLTRIDIEPGRISVEVEVMSVELATLTDERAQHLRARLGEAIDGVLDRAWETEK